MAVGVDVANRVKSRPTTSTGRLPARQPAPARRPSLVAASRKIDLRTRDGIKLVRKPETWQKESWAFFRSVPPLTFGGSYKGSALSRVRPYPAIVLNPDEPPVALVDAAESDEPEAAGITPAIAEAAELEFGRLSNARGGIPALMSAATIGLTMAGECYLVGWPATATEEERWGVYSSSAIDVRSGSVTVKERAGSGKGEPLPEGAFLARVWCADPEWPGDPWSNMRSALGAAEEYVIWARVFRAVAKSGANGGILTMPTELDQEPPARAGDEEGPQDELTELQRSLVDYVTESIESDDTVAAAAPWVLDGAAEFLDRVKWINTTRNIDQKVLERLDALKGEFAHGVDLPVEVIKGMGEVNHWCVDDETEALTLQGWKGHADLAAGDVVLTLNHETGMSEWQPVERMYRAGVVDEPMLLLDGMGHSSHTTLGHRWPVIRPRWADGDPTPHDSREFTTSGELGPEHRIPAAAPNADVPVDPKWDDDFVELMAWFWTEGSIAPYGSISISQSHSRNPERVERIRNALTRLYGPASASMRGDVGEAWREARQPNTHSYGGPVTVFYLSREASKPLVANCPGLVVDREWVRSLTAPQLRLFTDVSEMGDGRHHRQGRSDIWQRRPEMLDGYELALILQGRMVTRTVSEGGETTSAWRKSTVRPVKASQARDARAVAERRSYTGVAWCPTTRNGTWFARRRGTHYFTGNSAWQVSDDTYKAHLEPTGQVFAQGLASAFLRPGLEGDGIDPAVLRRIVVALDPSGLVARPNRAADAKELHAKGVLSDEALLRYLAFADADAPDEEELLRRYALDRGVGGVNLTTAVMNRTITADDPLDVAPEPRNGGGGGAGGGEPTPPEEGGEPVPATLPAAAAQALPSGWAPPALTAAADEDDEDGDPWLLLGLALARIESRLLDRLTVAASDDASEALRKAGSRLKSQAQGNAATRDRVRDVAPEDVPSVLGPELVAAMADPDTLLAGSLERLEGRWDSWVAAAQAQVADQCSRVAGSAPDPAGAEAAIGAFRDAAPAARADGWNEAERQTRRLLADRLTSNVIDIIEGEGDPASHVPAGLLRDALARAGGGTPGVGPSGPAQHSGPAGLTTGPRVRALLDALGAQTMAWRWDHGMPATPFEPHQALDGYEFDRWDDPRLESVTPWPNVGHYHPGDHRGCLCGATPVISGPGRERASAASQMGSVSTGDAESARLAAAERLAAAAGTDAWEVNQGYVTVTYAPMNAALRSGELNAFTAQAIARMDASFNTLGVTNRQRMTVHRRVDADHPIANAGPGDAFIEDGYLSTSVADSNAGVFGPVHLNISVVPGARFQAGDPTQGELIFTRGARLRVTANRPGQGGSRQVDVELSP